MATSYAFAGRTPTKPIPEPSCSTWYSCPVILAADREGPKAESWNPACQSGGPMQDSRRVIRLRAALENASIHCVPIHFETDGFVGERQAKYSAVIEPLP